MTTPTLPDRLLAEANLAVVPPRTAEILREAHAALSGRVPEGDMARALEWLRGFGWVVPDTVKSAIEEAIAAYDPERAGAFSGKLSGREAWVLVQRHWVENVGYAASMLENSESRIDQLQAPALRKLIAEMPAAPSAKGV